MESGLAYVKDLKSKHFRKNICYDISSFGNSKICYWDEKLNSFRVLEESIYREVR